MHIQRMRLSLQSGFSVNKWPVVHNLFSEQVYPSHFIRTHCIHDTLQEAVIKIKILSQVE